MIFKKMSLCDLYKIIRKKQLRENFPNLNDLKQ